VLYVFDFYKVTKFYSIKQLIVSLYLHYFLNSF